tara:strand:+ start:294 stop:1610 length:1317 start_codon:yes stop_codon:yes gene_type:complete
MIKFPKSIKEIDLSALKPDAEAIKYLFTNLENGMKYSGSHLLYERGVFPDTYWQSSRNSEFNNLFYSMKPIFKYEIIDSGDYVEMKQLESQIHRKEKVNSNPMYYNLAVAGGAYQEPVRSELCKYIVKLIKDGHFRSKTLWRVDHLNTLDKLQVRVEVPDVSEIANKMREAGDARNADPVLIWQLEEDTIGDGNRTLKAATKAKIPLVSVDIIPKAFIEEYGLTMDEMIRVGQLLNPKPQKESEPTDEDTIIETLLGYVKTHGTPIKAKSNKDYIIDLGYSHQKATNIIATALEQQANNDINAKGKTCIKYDGGKNNPKIKEIVNGLEDENTIVITGSAGTPLRIVADAIDAIDLKPDWQTLIIKPYFEKETNRRAWDGVVNVCSKTKKRTFKVGTKVAVERRLSTYLRYSPTTEDGIPRVIFMDSMPHYQPKMTKGK